MNIALDPHRDCRGDPILQFQGLMRRSVELFDPEVAAALAVDELYGDAQPFTRLPHAALDKVSRGQFVRRLPCINGAPSVGQGRATGGDGEGSKPPEGGDDVVDDAVGEPAQAGIVAAVEGQYREARGSGAIRGGRVRRRGDQTVADAWHGDDPFACPASPTESLPKGRDLYREVAFLDDGAGPGACQQVLLGDRAASILSQRGQNGEGALPEGHGNAIPQKCTPREVENKGTKSERSVIHASVYSAGRSQDRPSSACGKL